MLYSFNKYLDKHKSLSLHGIGLLKLEQKAARLDFAEKMLYPPVKKIYFNEESAPNNNQFFAFLSKDMQVDKITSVKLYNEEMQRIKDALAQNGTYSLDGIGMLQKQPEGSVYFESYHDIALPVISVERVIRKEDTHTVMVGETEHTNKHMEELLAQGDISTQRKNYWWIIVLLVIIIAAVGLYFYFNGNTM